VVRGLAAIVVATAIAIPARPARAGDRLGVVVRAAGGGDALAIARLRGQIADLAVDATDAPGPLEPSLAAQLDEAAALAREHGARAVVWFVPRGGGLAVAIATPADRRLFVRDIPAADPSAVAEAAAVAARGALEAIAGGGTIGVAVPLPPPRVRLEGSIGWQVALDGGADGGAHAIAERGSLVRGPWALSLEGSIGPPRRRDGAAVVELMRADARLAAERRLGPLALGVGAGVLLYHRATVTAPAGTAPTPSSLTAALVAGPEVRLRWRPRWSPLGIELTAGLDVVAGAPELAVDLGGSQQVIDRIRVAQPRLGLSLVAGLP